MMTAEIETLYHLTMIEIQKIQLCVSYGIIITLMGFVALGYIGIAHAMLKKNK